MLNIDCISKKYGDVEALKEISIELALNEILAIIGPSGCGKTTLLRLIAGFEQPDEGRVRIDNIEVSSPTRITPPSRRKLSMIFQDLALWPHMTAREHIAFVLEKDGRSKKDYNLMIDGILEDVNLHSHGRRMPHELSGGEKQRLAIARALAQKPTYLLMDEPFSSLDMILKDELQELVLSLKSNYRMGIIYVTHNMDEAIYLADRIAIINKGRLVQIDSKEKVLNNPKNEFVRRLMKIG